MSSVVSKNLFDLLGNDADEEGQFTAPPVEPVEKPAARRGKRDAPLEAPSRDTTSTGRGGGSGGRGGGPGGRGGRGGRRGDFVGSEQAFQDRSVGRSANRDKPTDDGLRRDRHANRLEGGRIQRGGSYDGRGARGGAGGRGGRGGKDDRHSRTAITDSNKQVAAGWGDESGTAEWKDEQAGQEIAWADQKAGGDESWGAVPTDGEGFTPAVAEETNEETKEENPQAEPEPIDTSKSYEQYLAEQAEKRLQLGGTPAARKANEGVSKKQPEGKEFAREEAEYFAGTGGKARREREKKEKNQLVLDHDFAPRERESTRGGGRGGRGRGRGEGAFRGEGRGRGGRGRGEFRGGRGGRGGTSPNVTDMSAFPSLGGS